MELSEKVKMRREQLGLSQEELALRMGYKSRSSINKIETGRPVTQKIIARLADALGVSIPYLMGWDEKPAGDLQAMGALAAELLLDPDAMEMVREYMGLSESERYAVRLVIASMSAKQKKTDAGASVVESKKFLKKTDCNM